MFSLIVEAPCQGLRRFEFDEDRLTVGRGDAVGFAIEHVAISRQQFAIHLEPGLAGASAYRLKAHPAATNPTFVCGQQAEDRELRHGDIITAGPVSMLFHVCVAFANSESGGQE